jgi:hypothetical protein
LQVSVHLQLFKRLNEALLRRAGDASPHHPNAWLLVRDARVQPGQDSRLGYPAHVDPQRRAAEVQGGDGE